jgi:hypothetical protein
MSLGLSLNSGPCGMWAKTFWAVGVILFPLW